MGSLRTLQRGHTCRDCGGKFSLHDLIDVDNYEGYVCERCVSNYCCCVGCDTVLRFDDVQGRDHDGDPYCRICWDRYLRKLQEEDDEED